MQRANLSLSLAAHGIDSGRNGITRGETGCDGLETVPGSASTRGVFFVLRKRGRLSPPFLPLPTRSGPLIAITNHTIDTACRDGYGRYGAVPVWMSAAHEERRVVLFPYQFMDEENGRSSENTPGPWKITRNNSGKIMGIYSDDGLMSTGSDVVAEFEFRPPHEANARLIAAAPRLLDACKEAMEEFGCPAEGTTDMTCDNLRRAIAQAEVPEWIEPKERDVWYDCYW